MVTLAEETRWMTARMASLSGRRRHRIQQTVGNADFVAGFEFVEVEAGIGGAEVIRLHGVKSRNPVQTFAVGDDVGLRGRWLGCGFDRRGRIFLTKRLGIRSELFEFGLLQFDGPLFVGETGFFLDPGQFFRGGDLDLVKRARSFRAPAFCASA